MDDLTSYWERSPPIRVQARCSVLRRAPLLCSIDKWFRYAWKTCNLSPQNGLEWIFHMSHFSVNLGYIVTSHMLMFLMKMCWLEGMF